MASDQQQVLFCPNCGAPVEPGQQFCDQCGVRLADYVPKNNAVTPAPPVAEPKKEVSDSTAQIEQEKNQDLPEQPESEAVTPSDVVESSPAPELKNDNAPAHEEQTAAEPDRPEKAVQENIQSKESTSEHAEDETADANIDASAAEPMPVAEDATSPENGTDDADAPVHERRFSFLALFGYIFGLSCWFINLWGVVGVLAIIFSSWALVTKVHRLSKVMAVMGLIGGTVNVAYAIAVFVTGGMTL
ncbi:zinc-ribbon domain-containing protein [Schleiferilactobacillus harbinensis]|uniref:zinc ribbon domain-containing protein n=1 Tax=Schleiferilactobacillus harbinensis TaxID=304207 RepID=UPI00123C3ABA|nr:zinc ribbon domain-containing protein [Schleiferilactobacillus harbinensis]QEU47808.1 zinc-ribbon domain-containing protein [Schleiferilactobacillus harbinensis]